MIILITGVHGFVGSNLVKALAINHTIYGLDIIAPDMIGVLRTFAWDDLEKSEMPAMDAIIHLAGKAHDTRNKAMTDVYFEINTGLTKRIFDWYLVNPIAKKFVFFSTAKAAAEYVHDILREDVKPTPKGPYGESKIQAENYILEKLEEKGVSRESMISIVPGKDMPTNEKSVYVFRPCMIHGPGNKGNLNLLYNVVSKGIPWPLGAFENRRTFTSVANICFAVDGVLTNDVPSGIYNLGDDMALSTNDLIEVICETMGRKAQIWYLPQKLMNGLAWIGGILHLPLNQERLRKLTENYVVSNVKIKEALGIKHMPVSAKEGLVRTIKSFQK